MPLTVLSDEQVAGLLENLTLDEYDALKTTIARALHSYSNNASTYDDGHQPERVAMKNHETGATTLFMPSCSPIAMGCKVVTLSAGTDTKPPIQPTGAVTLLSPLGQPTGFIHARNLTAFRTALASSCLLSKRASVKTITAFGSGLQTYWHVRLALLSRGSSIKHVNIIARSFSENARTILRRFHAVPAAAKAREGWAATTFGVLTPGYGEYARLAREQVADADVVFCCVPSREPLFEADLLTSHEGRRKGRLVVAVGGAAPGTRELPRELLLQAVKREGSHLHFHKHAPDGGAVVVDTIEGVLKDSGEIVEAGLKPSQLVELGELVELHRQSEGDESKKDKKLATWLSEGTVIYKSVGLGLMDLAVGSHLIELAASKGVGTVIPAF
ncbi:hypothetical protein F5X68DRAFT_203443 [Plectosphaerella plurivora]|uniref:NAD(P)-binding protein n=1 Tax=Plectosphaerella plurivora TaxID=936078 RepID=A0A9P8VGC2_9PEZI|nr:hypothetical protein F5X68DRAFT_203443 [Plectosphaerella plurivora]